MKVKISLNKAPSYTEVQESILWTLLHDKEHILVRGRRAGELDNLIRKFKQTLSGRLYRGIPREELAVIRRQQGVIKQNAYLSFSEDKSTAKDFAKGYKTNTVLELKGNPKLQAICYHKLASVLIKAADLDKEFGGREEDREYTLELLEEELEWLTSFDFSFKVVGERKEGSFIILQVEAA